MIDRRRLLVSAAAGAGLAALPSLAFARADAVVIDQVRIPADVVNEVVEA